MSASTANGSPFGPGDRIPGTKYQVVRELGAGGMGVVYLVVKPPNIQGVLKLMSSELAELTEHRTRFFDEVRILAQLDHPNIVKVFDYDALPDGTPFYVMELLVGRTVRDVLGTIGRVRPRVAYEITRQLLEALQCAHTHEVPVIHRDIKPENIFLHTPRYGEPIVKLIDFGVSAVADRKHDGSFVGTWSYAAPEQIRGEAPTPATDLYAAGLVLFELLAGVGPFDHHADWVAVSKAQLGEVPAPVSKFAPWVPSSIVGLIASALAKDPRARPKDAYAFAERLFELEWANDDKDPYDPTREGPAAGPAARGEPAPLRKVLDTLTAGSAAANETTPNTSVLIDGLAAAPRKPPSRRERASDPSLAHGPTTPRAGPAGALASPRPPTAITADAARLSRPSATPSPAPAVGARDTFTSQQSDARALPRSRANLALAGVALVCALAFAGAFALRKRGHPATPPTTTTTATAAPTDPARVTSEPGPSFSIPPSASAPLPSTPAPPLSASVAVPVPEDPPRAPSSHPPARPRSSPSTARAPGPVTPTTPSASAGKPRSDYMRDGLP